MRASPKNDKFTSNAKSFTLILKCQLQRFDKLSLSDKLRHVENCFDINFRKFIFGLLLSAVKVLKWQLGWLFRKRTGKYALSYRRKHVRRWDVTWHQYQLTLSKKDTVHYLQDSSEAWWEWLHITTKTKRNHILIRKRVLINYKLRDCKLLMWSYKPTAACID